MNFKPILVIVVYIFNNSVQDNMVRSKYRLPTNVLPVKYNLQIMTNLDEPDFGFTGNVTIKIYILNATNKIVLHSKGLNVTKSEIKVWILNKNKMTSTISVTNLQLDEMKDFLVLTVKQTLIKDAHYILSIPFAGQLYQQLAGFYRSSYTDKATGKTKWLAVTQFKPIDARRAFPCFDEPAIKAIFSISIGHAKKYKALSNMPLMSIDNVKEKQSWMLETFEDTKPMSTYLVGYMVSELDHRISNLNYSPGIVCRVWARKDVIDQVEFARDIAPKVLTFFEKYFDIEYPLPKQDMVAVPDFSFSAMENWGLITFRERALLYDSNQSSIFDKHTVANVLCHELAHQWFGNLVTMNWWTNLWLNEGFATQIGALGVHYLFPEWKTLDSETVDNLLLIFELDSLSSSHPVSLSISHPTEINQIFDIISYKKGCFLLYMMYHFLTEEVFQSGVKKYLKKHRYSNATQDDLWQSMTEAAHAKSILPSTDNVKMIMDTWTLDTGYPLLTIRRQYANKTALIVQERYLSSKFRLSKEKLIKTFWIVPLTYTSATESDFQTTKPKAWLPCGGPYMMTNLAREQDWVIFNIKAIALYRVNYDEENWRMLSATLTDKDNFKKIASLNRVLLISDMLALAWIKRLEYKQVFNTLQYLKHEDEYLPWKTALHGFRHLASMLIHSPIYSQYKNYVRQLIEPSYQRLGGNISRIPKDYENIKHHCMILKYACYYDIEDCKTQTGNLFSKWHVQTSPSQYNLIPSNLRRDVYCNALRYSDEEDWMFLWKRYTESNVASEKNIILEALACSQDVDILNKYLNWSLNKTKIRKQDTLLVFHQVSYNEIGFSAAKKFLIENFEKIYNLHAYKPSNLGYYVKAIANQIIDQKNLNEFETFINSKAVKLKASNMMVLQGIETAKNNIAWHSVQFRKILQYFSTDKIME